MNIFKKIYNYRELLKTNVKKEIRGRYKNSFLGVLWSFLNPLLQLAVYLSYYANINFEDNFSPIKIWENLIFKNSLDEKIVVPMRFKTPEKKMYEGAYVHEPITGLKGCVASFDYTSLYPKIMELFYIGADVHCRNEEKNKLYTDMLNVLENDNTEKSHEMLSEIKTTGIFNEFYIKKCDDIIENNNNFLYIENSVEEIANKYGLDKYGEETETNITH